MKWQIEGARMGRRWFLTDDDGEPTGWTIEHCGHPTALYPYLIYSPSGQSVVAPSCMAWSRVADAQDAAEQLQRGEIDTVTVYYIDGGHRLAALYLGGAYRGATESLRAKSSGGVYRMEKRKRGVK